MADNLIPHPRHVRQFNWLMILLVLILILLMIIAIAAFVRYAPAESAVKAAFNIT